MLQKKVLFICVHNSARSQMAEAFMNHLSNGRYLAESAGLVAGALNPYVVKVMEEEGIDISENKTDEVFKFYQEGRIYYYVFRVLDGEAAERCPVFPDIKECFHWDIKDPSSFKGSEEQKMKLTRQVRDEIKNKITEWLQNH